MVFCSPTECKIPTWDVHFFHRALFRALRLHLRNREISFYKSTDGSIGYTDALPLFSSVCCRAPIALRNCDVVYRPELWLLSLCRLGRCAVHSYDALLSLAMG